MKQSDNLATVFHYVAKYDFFLFCESRTFVFYIEKCVVFENIATPDLNPE